MITQTPLRGNLKAFTLIEVMLGAALLVTVLVSIIAVYMICFELVSTSRNMTFAVNEAQAMMEEIRDYDFYIIYSYYNNKTFTVSEITSGNSRGVVYVDNSNPSLLKVTISVCWRDRTRTIGEDLDFDGVLDSGEDLNKNGIIDSPAQIVSLITER